LTKNEQARNSDKELIWTVYLDLGIVKEVDWFGKRECILKESILSGKMPSFESITRARRKIQQTFPNLGATDPTVIARRKQKQDTKGTFIYREET